MSLRVVLAACWVSYVIVDAGCSSWADQQAGQTWTIKNGGNDLSSTCANLPSDLNASTTYKFEVSVGLSTDNVCMKHILQQQPCMNVTGCNIDCAQAKGVGKASITANCTSDGWTSMGAIHFGCLNTVSGCECPDTGSFSLSYTVVTPTSDATTTDASNTDSTTTDATTTDASNTDSTTTVAPACTSACACNASDVAGVVEVLECKGNFTCREEKLALLRASNAGCSTCFLANQLNVGYVTACVPASARDAAYPCASVCGPACRSEANASKPECRACVECLSGVVSTTAPNVVSTTAPNVVSTTAPNGITKVTVDLTLTSTIAFTAELNTTAKASVTVAYCMACKDTFNDKGITLLENDIVCDIQKTGGRRRLLAVAYSLSAKFAVAVSSADAATIKAVTEDKAIFATALATKLVANPAVTAANGNVAVDASAVLTSAVLMDVSDVSDVLNSGASPARALVQPLACMLFVAALLA